jgi:diaminohydroxyphosphoribosylaminopyrimidine deaminase/5-amino-6-(5-phosphoribosylamino)uracil reductase
VNALRDAGAEVVEGELGSDGRLALEPLLAHLGRRNVMSVLCEGGPALAAGLIRAGLVDKFRLFYAPKLVGGDGRDGLAALGIDQMKDASGLQIKDVERVGDDVLITAYPQSGV